MSNEKQSREQNTLAVIPSQTEELTQTSTAVDTALLPLKSLVWGYETIAGYLSAAISKRLKKIPPEEIDTPSPHIAGPAVEALRFTGHEENLRELFANLIATAMDKNTAEKAHPAFVEVIRNITADEAALLKAFLENKSYSLIDARSKSNEEGDFSFRTLYSNYSGLSKVVSLHRPLLIPSYLNNLCRLGILEIPAGELLADESEYNALEKEFGEIESLGEKLSEEGRRLDFDRKVVQLTTFGRQFIKAVVEEK